MIVRNRVAYALWGFTAVVMTFVVSMTALAVGGDYGESESPALIWGVLILFWFGGLGLLSYAMNQPVTTVAIAVGGGLDITQRYPFRRNVRHIELADILDVSVIEGVDDEGDPYFHTRMALTDGSSVNIKESHDRQRCEAARDRFRSAIS